MPKLRFNTDQGHATVELLRSVSTGLQTTLQNAWTSSDTLVAGAWQAPAAQEFHAGIVAWRQRLEQALVELERLDRQLGVEIQEWEETAVVFGEGANLGTAGQIPPRPTPLPDNSQDTPPTSEPPSSEEPKSRYDGSTPAPGTGGKPWIPTDPSLKGDSSNRSSNLYDDIINQFAVETNPRYQANQQGKGETYCNIFAWDVSSAMGAEVPHWVGGDGNATGVGQGFELDANGSIRWLQSSGQEHGWRAVSAEQAQAMACLGLPVVAGWVNLGGIGHMAMVRPGSYSPEKGPVVAQAGAQNSNSVRVADSFGRGWQKNEVVYYVHN